MTVAADVTPRQARVNSYYAYAGAIVAQTGVQLVAVSLPFMRDDVGLTDTQLALVMSVYLLPAAIFAIPVGLLADRFGRRRVYGWAMIAFGIAGILLQFLTQSFGVFLVIRFLQGIAFAGLLPLTMTILGDAFRGPELIRAQGRRSVAMLIGDGALPVLGGVLVAITWQTPWLGQLLGIPFGIAVLFNMTDPTSLRAAGKKRGSFSEYLQIFKGSAVYALQYAGFLRMVLKFSLLTFMPVLLVDVRDFSPAYAGLVVGAAAVIGIVPSATAGRIAPFARPTTFVVVGLAFQAVGLAIMALSPWSVAILAGSLTYGIADGISSVFVNSFVASATEAKHRASFVAATGAVRNFAKFVGPAVLGVLILVMSLPSAFALVSGITLASAFLMMPLRGLEHRLTDQRQAPAPQPESRSDAGGS